MMRCLFLLLFESFIEGAFSVFSELFRKYLDAFGVGLLAEVEYKLSYLPLFYDDLEKHLVYITV